MIIVKDYTGVLGVDVEYIEKLDHEFNAWLSNEGFCIYSGLDEKNAKVKLYASVVPLLINGIQFQKKCSELRDIFSAINRMLRLYANGDEHLQHLFKKYRQYDKALKISSPTQLQTLYSRFDCHITENGLEILEFNAACPGGFYYTDMVRKRWSEFMSTFHKEVRLTSIKEMDKPKNFAEYYIGQFNLWAKNNNKSILDKKKRIAFIKVDSEYANEIPQFIEQFEKAGWEAEWVEIGDLDFYNGAVYAVGKRIDAFYHKFDPLSINRDSFCDYLQHCEKGNCFYMNPFQALLLAEDKLSLAYLSDERFNKYLSGSEYNTVVKYIPWTRKIEQRRTFYEGRDVDLLQHIRRNKDELVIKSSNETRGYNVFIGDQLTSGEWEKCVDLGLSEEWVVQKRIWSQGMSEKCSNNSADRLYNDFSIFFGQNQPINVMSRISSNPVVNVFRQGGFVPVLIV